MLIILAFHSSCVLIGLILHILVVLIGKIRKGLRVGSVLGFEICSILAVTLLQSVLKFSYLAVVGVLKLGHIIGVLLLSGTPIRCVSVRIDSHLGNIVI